MQIKKVFVDLDKQNKTDMRILINNMYLLLVDEEAEIKESSWYENNGVLFISDNEYNEGNNPNVKGLNNSVIAYYPLTKEAKELDLPLLPNPLKEVYVEELAEKVRSEKYHDNTLRYPDYNIGFEDGYKAAHPKQFSLDDISSFFVGEGKEGGLFDDFLDFRINNDSKITFKEWYIKNNQSLSTQQLPKEFITKVVKGELQCKIVNNPFKEYEFSEELVGTYKY